MSDSDVDALMERAPQVFRELLLAEGVSRSTITRVVTKFRDAGRRSPPTAVYSSIGPGRPQSAADGNRANRWELPSDHKYFAERRTAQLVEVKFYLQALSLRGAPEIEYDRAPSAFMWLLGHYWLPGEYLDPIMRRPIDFDAFMDNPRLLTSGHLFPLARGGYHEPSNAFLMLARSNTLQSDLTFDEFLALIDDILVRQAEIGILPNPDKLPGHAFLETLIGEIESSN